MAKATIAGTDTVNAALETKCNANFTELYNYLTGVASPTLLAPTIANLESATHDHADDAGGGTTLGTTWTDYSSTSTVTGFSSYTIKQILYKTIGDMVYVCFAIQGTSSTTGLTFTVPYSAGSGSTVYQAVYVTDASAAQAAPGCLILTAGQDEVALYKTWAAGAFTASGAKTGIGSFWYHK